MPFFPKSKSPTLIFPKFRIKAGVTKREFLKQILAIPIFNVILQGIQRDDMPTVYGGGNDRYCPAGFLLRSERAIEGNEKLQWKNMNGEFFTTGVAQTPVVSFDSPLCRFWQCRPLGGPERKQI